MTDKRQIIDADGHVAEDSAAIIARMPREYQDKAREQPFNPFPPFDHLHAGHLVDMPPGAFNRKVGPREWLAFLDEVGIDTTVLYPTAGVASAIPCSSLDISAEPFTSIASNGMTQPAAPVSLRANSQCRRWL